MPIDDHVNQMRHSIYGRKYGVDDRGFPVGPLGNRNATETILTTAPSTLAAGGTSLLQATAAAAYELTPPSASMQGVQKRIVHNSTGAVVLYVKLTSGGFLSAMGTTQQTIALSTRGVSVDLEYVTTGLVAVVALNSTSTAGYVDVRATT